MVKDSSGLKLYVHHALREQVSEGDMTYVADLLEDLRQRANQYPDDVFQQLSNLSVGPLITDAVGWIELHGATVETIYPDYSLCDA